MSDQKYPLALVTGSARRLGFAIAEGLARDGYAIGLHYHQSGVDALDVARRFEEIGVPVLLLPADLSKPEQVTTMFNKLDACPWELKVLVNSAAVMPRQSLLEITPDEWDSVMDINLKAPWLCAREASRRMQGEGVIINLSDAGLSKNWTHYSAYQVAKTGLEKMTRLLARELAPDIRVNAIAPGLVLKSDDITEEQWQALVDRLPLKKSTGVEPIVEAVRFLINNSHITGQILTVDGGYQLV